MSAKSIGLQIGLIRQMGKFKVQSLHNKGSVNVCFPIFFPPFLIIAQY